MKTTATQLSDCVILEQNLHGDERGYFLESFNQEGIQEALNTQFNIAQVNVAMSSKNVLRGLHFQIPPKAQTKIVGVMSGSVLDVVVDLRKDSPTFGKHHKQILDRPGLMLVVPKGFAHGYLTLEEETRFFYYVDDFYSPENERGLLYNDPQIGIDWGFEQEPVISEKDKKQPLLDQLDNYFK